MRRLLVGTLIVLLGCAPKPLTMNKVRCVAKGISQEGVTSFVERDPETRHVIADPKDGVEYEIQVFPMRIDVEMLFTGRGRIHWLPIYKDYVFLFHNRALLFWGFPHEFSRSCDERIRRLAPLIMEALGVCDE